MEQIFEFLKKAGLSPSQSFTPNHSIFWGEHEFRVLPVRGTTTRLQFFKKGQHILGFENQEQAVDYLAFYISKNTTPPT